MSAKPPLPDDLWVKTPADAKAAILSLVDSFERRIAALEARLNRNSSDSSKPPAPARCKSKRGRDCSETSSQGWSRSDAIHITRLDSRANWRYKLLQLWLVYY